MRSFRLIFTDGHDTGLYSWDYLLELGKNQDQLWQDYLARLAKAGASREDSAAPVRPAVAPSAGWKKL